MKNLYCFFFIAFLNIPIFSQSHIELKESNSCSINGRITSRNIKLFESNSNAIEIIDNILSEIGAERSFLIFAGNVSNAVARVENGKRYIIYNPNFINHLIDVSQSYWSAIGVLAHEIGHHINGHTLDGLGSRPNKEIKADEFAGFVMFKMGASLLEAQSTFRNNLMYQEFDSRTHPRTSARLEAIALGWQKAKEKSIQPKNSLNKTNLKAWIELAEDYHYENNYIESLKWFRKAAEYGNAYAEYSIGEFYEEGIGGVQKDMRKAAYWYKKAASQGESEAQMWLGTLYEEGDGVPVDLEKAKYWYYKACENGDTQGCNFLIELKKN